MPDGTTRFTGSDGVAINHFMGCSTFSECVALIATHPTHTARGRA